MTLVPKLLLCATLFPAVLGAGPVDGRAPAKARPALALSPCRLPGLDEDALCGRLWVPENRRADEGRWIDINVAVLKATGATRLPDPVVPLAGGPGGAVVSEAANSASQFKDLRVSRDILLVDGRGTGGSHALLCPYQKAELGAEQQLEAFLPPAGVRECRTYLERIADPRFYTTPDQVDDLEKVREALGYPQLNLVGVSYGTRTALVYMRRYPARVRTAVLWGVAPPDMRLPESFARDAQNALDGWLAECHGEEACRQAFPDSAADLRTVLARLDRGSVRVALPNPQGGQREFALTRNGFIQTLRYMLYVPAAAVRIPLYLRLAADGDFGPLAETALSLGTSFLGGSAEGLYLSVTCSEDVPFVDEAASRRSNAGTFLGDFRLERQKEACGLWPRGTLPRGYAAPVRSAVPTLIVTGERDPVTPPARGEAVLRHLSRGRHLVVPDGGHDLEGLEGVACLDGLATTFVEAGAVEGLDTSCLAGLRRPPFPLAR